MNDDTFYRSRTDTELAALHAWIMREISEIPPAEMLDDKHKAAFDSLWAVRAESARRVIDGGVK